MHEFPRKDVISLVWTHLSSPLGPLTLSAEDEAITGLWLPEHRNIPAFAQAEYDPTFPLFLAAENWLQRYFSREQPTESLPLALNGSPFSLSVWALLQEIPYGAVCTYGQISRALTAQGIPSSPQAVGGAVGRNPISLLIPCHRVIGANGSLTGYASGLAAKRFLLQLEGVFLPPPTENRAESTDRRPVCRPLPL